MRRKLTAVLSRIAADLREGSYGALPDDSIPYSAMFGHLVPASRSGN